MSGTWWEEGELHNVGEWIGRVLWYGLVIFEGWRVTCLEEAVGNIGGK